MTATTRSRRRAKAGGGIRGTEGIAGWLFTAPMMVILGLFLFIPILMALYVSFTNWNGNGSPFSGGRNAEWVGGQNYIDAFQAYPPFQQAVRNNVLWLDKGDAKFPGLRKKQDWNTLRISANGPRLQVFLNGTQICDVSDNPTDPAEAKWKEAGPISVQSPYTSGFEGFVKYRNIRIRQL